MNWKKEAENDLKAHEKRKAALRSLAEEIRELQARTYGSTTQPQTRCLYRAAQARLRSD